MIRLVLAFLLVFSIALVLFPLLILIALVLFPFSLVPAWHDAVHKLAGDVGAAAVVIIRVLLGRRA